MFIDKFNLSGLLQNVEKMREMVEKTQEEMKKETVVGESGAGAVQVTMNAGHEAIDITIDPTLLTEDKAIVEELIIAAINDANHKIREFTESKMKRAADMFGDDPSAVLSELTSDDKDES